MRAQHQHDLEHDSGWVELPKALDRKPRHAGRECPWQWTFPATRIYRDRDTRQRRRHHIHETVLQRVVREAVHSADILKRATCQPSVTRSRPTSWRTAPTSEQLQKLLGHDDLNTTIIYTHVLNHVPAGVKSPADRLLGV